MQVDEQPLFEDEKELEDANKVEFDFLISLNGDNESLFNKKRVYIYEENNTTIRSFKTIDYLNPKEDDMDLLLVESAQSSVKLLAQV